MKAKNQWKILTETTHYILQKVNIKDITMDCIKLHNTKLSAVSFYTNQIIFLSSVGNNSTYIYYNLYLTVITKKYILW